MDSIALLLFLLLMIIFAAYECVMMTKEVVAEFRARREFAAYKHSVGLEMKAIIKSLEEHGTNTNSH